MQDPVTRFTTAEASAYLARVHGVKVATDTLKKYAILGNGPPYRKFGAYRNAPRFYAPSDLDAWALARFTPVLNSTSQLTAA